MPTMRDNPRPTWSWMMMRAADLERQVYDLRAEAVERRCAAEDSGGARCTRDRGHSNNKHRHSQEDLPDMATAPKSGPDPSEDLCVGDVDACPFDHDHEVQRRPGPHPSLPESLTTAPNPLDPRPDCPGEFHGADGGACEVCGWDSHTIPTQGAAGPTCAHGVLITDGCLKCGRVVHRRGTRVNGS